MDTIDRNIIALLKRDARVPMKTIAGKVGLARSSVRDQIQRLEKIGTIRRYTVMTDMRDSGSLLALLSIVLEKTPLPQVIEQIVRMPQVRRCYSLSGAVDLLTEVEAVNTADLNSVRDAISSICGVRSLSTATVLKVEFGLA